MQSRLLLLGVPGGLGDVASRRVRLLLRQVVRGRPGGDRQRLEVRLMQTAGTDSGDTVNIGDVSYKLKTPKNPELVPQNYISESPAQSIVQHLRWIMQKDLLGQDIFLIGPPGPLRRSVAMQYLELTKREVEYIALSRDTTETDLKQRREIRAGTAFYIDQCAVRAATEGRTLVLEGLEKAERNVLPVLNNLLENREMQLEDGRFLMSAERYDKLLQDHTKEELDAWKIVRVSEHFRVIALGLPVPKYPGNPLDPPLRSRFQARDIYFLPFRDQLNLLYSVGANVSAEKVSQLLSFATTLCSQESSTLGLPDFPLDSLPAAVQILNSFPMMSIEHAIQWLYPYTILLGQEGKMAVEGVLKRFELQGSGNSLLPKEIIRVERMTDNCISQAHVTIQVAGKEVTIKGCGKTVIAKNFADILGYNIEPIMLYQDMTARDLLQQRYTLPNGDTAWRSSPLVNAAREGKLVLLDGIHRVNAGTLAVLQRLIHDRELSLYDGSRLLRQDRYLSLKEGLQLTDEQLQERSIFPIHPSFRIIALAEPPVIGSTTQQWLGPEFLTMFFFHHMKPLVKSEEIQVIKEMVPSVPQEALEKLLSVTHKLRETQDPTAQSLAASLSTRQLLRIARRLSQYPNENLHDAITKACLSRFLPSLARSALEKNLADAAIEINTNDSLEPELESYKCEIVSGSLRIGAVSAPVYNAQEKMKVPDVLFYDNVQHMIVMEDMLKDFVLGEHLLLVGNQGVGKNKIMDRFLHLLNRPREYIQLHRDTTVQTLTLQPSVKDGLIVYEDSPLVKAVKMGHILVVDEADKAPTNVTCILKTLVENGEMILADGRRIVAHAANVDGRENVIVIHPDFRMVVLANRPGFPFLGNDFFGTLGDIFSCHAIDNPKPHSELEMLKQYGPNVPEAILQKLVAAFGELRNLADQGIINYPYSTREVVNIVKHLQKFPTEGLASVVRNVFDFDSYNNDMREILMNTLHKYGIPIGAKPTNVHLAKELPLPEQTFMGYWITGQAGNGMQKILCPVQTSHIDIKGPVLANIEEYPIEKHEARFLNFTEEYVSWRFPLDEVNLICDIAVSHENGEHTLYVAACNPISLYFMNLTGKNGFFVDFFDIFPRMISGAWRPFVTVAPLGSPLRGQVVLHEEQSNAILLLDTTGRAIRHLILPVDEFASKKSSWWNKEGGETYRMCKEFSHKNWLVFYKQTGNTLTVLDVLEGLTHTISLPINLKAVFLVAEDKWLLVENKTNQKYLLTKPAHIGSEDTGACQLYMLKEELPSTGFGVTQETEFCIPHKVSSDQLSSENLSSAVGQKIASPNRVLSDENSYATVVVGFPDLMSPSEVYSWKRPSSLEKPNVTNTGIYGGKRTNATPRHKNCVTLTHTNQVVRILPAGEVPLKDIFPKGVTPPQTAGYIEVTDLQAKKLRYIPVPSAESLSPYTAWISAISDTDALLAEWDKSGIVTVDMGGRVRLWETGLDRLQQSLMEWRNMIGQDSDKPVQITIERDSNEDVSDPKHGKEDPDNMPHVGGNTWAGGTGGRDTAGLGGKGGPYRLDAGHPVYQVSEVEKDAVPEHVKRAAREMAQRAFQQRLKEIQMSEYDAATYERFSGAVQRQVHALRVILDNLQAKGKERQWLRHQATGELDDAKIIDGLAGEKAIYKRRGDLEPQLGSPQQKPKRLRLVVDVSGSMYRFNGVDRRLERSMEAVCMVMEAFENYEEKFKYDIAGHSGDGYNISLVPANKIPKDNKQRLEILKTMHAHSQFCMSGDHTLEGTEHAIKDITKEEADEYFVIILSDANLSRYGINPARFAQILTSDPQVNAFAIFIGSLGDQAARLQRTLPAGRSFVAMDTKKIPQILQQIFTSTMLSSI
ncbi:von Willebrand factor A domain-containing protein 8 isoform X2 [Cricetulus griseus]|uniref:von Willebrand factor A domain-containing protein 8 n=1 Tax=Cricetulus griseus TaxID=10029 RepID=A0A9J7J7R8_CRIGR|nr:von Willebrand factor A domain-containing protein 8 isoform X2 [Cricetulus griseus]XP_027292843.1 von Willebrand factor A domain-containing protein 8 isoform X2 [Cricetulus griseus]